MCFACQVARFVRLQRAFQIACFEFAVKSGVLGHIKKKKVFSSLRRAGRVLAAFWLRFVAFPLCVLSGPFLFCVSRFGLRFIRQNLRFGCVFAKLSCVLRRVSELRFKSLRSASRFGLPLRSRHRVSEAFSRDILQQGVWPPRELEAKISVPDAISDRDSFPEAI